MCINYVSLVHFRYRFSDTKKPPRFKFFKYFVRKFRYFHAPASHIQGVSLPFIKTQVQFIELSGERVIVPAAVEEGDQQRDNHQHSTDNDADNIQF